MIIIGIDPGLDGALAVIFPSGLAYLYDTPTLNVGRNGKVRREYDTTRLAQPLLDIKVLATEPIRTLVESVHAMPKQGVRSMFTLGYGLGVWEGVLAGLGIPYERVTPQRWKKTLMDGQGKEKDAARLVAMRLFPSVADQLRRKRDDGRAEALLIAEYGRRTHEPGVMVRVDRAGG